MRGATIVESRREPSLGKSSKKVTAPPMRVTVTERDYRTNNNFYS